MNEEREAVRLTPKEHEAYEEMFNECRTRIDAENRQRDLELQKKQNGRLWI